MRCSPHVPKESAKDARFEGARIKPYYHQLEDFKTMVITKKRVKSEAQEKKMGENFGDLGDRWSDKDGEFFSFNVSPHQSANKDPVNELVDALDDLVDEKISVVKVSTAQTVRGKDLAQPFNCIDKVYCNFVLEQFLIKYSWRHCKFPWCNDIFINGRFWDALIGLDDKRLGWLLDDHIELLVWYMWHFRQSCHDWSIVSCYFLTLVFQDSMPFFYVTDEIYPMAWRDVEQVFIPINEPKRHWSLAQFHIQSGNVTFYDSQNIKGVEYRLWYLKMRSCLETKMHVLLHRTGVFSSKGINPNSYSIKFSQEHNVPQQGGLFGDYGVFVCLFLYRLAHGIPLAVKDPIQMALAYQEKKVKFYFEHKIICPS
ncbi:phospholipase-like protein [Tanacetum coccineum]|uniref:Phospholipase-like protein n=1 Tax=Tanacetum coccineum TaxID=301880 RepID=A0ABQ4XL50_9ASTR